MDLNQKGSVNMLVVVGALIVIGIAGYFVLTRDTKTSVNMQRQNNNQVASDQKGMIISLSIEPSTKAQGGWIMYRNGAKAVLKGKNLKSAEVRYFPTGTGITDSSLGGRMIKISQSQDGDTWEVKLPTFILATNFWVEAEDLEGNKIKSADLGNVGYQD